MTRRAGPAWIAKKKMIWISWTRRAGPALIVEQEMNWPYLWQLVRQTKRPADTRRPGPDEQMSAKSLQIY